MPNRITLDYTVIENCEAAANFSSIGTVTATTDFTDFAERQGTQVVAFTLPAAQTKSGIRTGTFTSIDVRDREVGAWFLNPKANEAANEVIAQVDTGVCLRLYSGANWADYNQPQHRLPDGTWQGGWLYLRASGAAGTEDANSGTWTNTQAAAVDSVAIVVTNATTGDANDGKNDTEYGVDWIIHYSKITVEGFKDGVSQPWTMDDIVAEADSATFGATDEGIWGVIEKTESFYRLYCGLQFGGDSAEPSAGALEVKNGFIFLNQSSSDHDYPVDVKRNFRFQLGEKNDTGSQTYAQNGAQLVAARDAKYPLASPVKCAPNLNVDSGGEFNVYSSLVKGFGVVNLGKNADSSSIECIKADFYDNDEVELRSTNVAFDRVRMYFDSGLEADIGKIFKEPTDFQNIEVFQVTDGIEYRVDMTAKGYVAGDTTYDFVVREGNTVRLVDSTFRKTKIKRST